MKIKYKIGEINKHGIKLLQRVYNGKTQYLCRCVCGIDYLTDFFGTTKPTKGCKQNKCCYKERRIKEFKGYEGISNNFFQSYKRRGLEFSISIEYIWNLYLEQNKKCALTGVPIILVPNYKQKTASLDRIDSSKGYIEDNVQWVHKDINFIKNAYNQNYFLSLCKQVTKHNQYPKLYLSGPIRGCTDSETINWRKNIKIDYKDNFEFLDPCRRDFRGREIDLRTATEIVVIDKNDINNSDALIANVWKYSAGTSMEIYYAFITGKIVAVVIPDGHNDVWLQQHSHFITNNLDNAMNFIKNELENRKIMS